MSKRISICLTLLVTLVLAFTVALASGNVNFSFTNTTTTSWGTSASTTREGNKWDIRIDSISNHGVGRVFRASDYAWGSGLYTYDSSTTGWRPAKSYKDIGGSATVVWRMRQDTDYSGAFSCSGVFRP